MNPQVLDPSHTADKPRVTDLSASARTCIHELHHKGPRGWQFTEPWGRLGHRVWEWAGPNMGPGGPESNEVRASLLS